MVTLKKPVEPADVEILASGLLFPEGPVAMADGSVLVAEIRGQAVRRIHPDGRVETLVECKGGPNGMAIGPDGALYICNNGGNTYRPDHFAATGPAADWQGGSIHRYDFGTGELRTLYTHCGPHRLSAPNDLVFDRDGGMYFTDFGKKHARHRDHGGLYYARVDGSSIVELAYPVAAPNGIGLSQDGRTLYLVETECARLWAFDIEAPGQLQKAPGNSPNGGRLLHAFPDYRRPDGMAVDSEGNLCVACLLAGCIAVVSPSGELLREVKVPDHYVTNIAFGGRERRTAFVTLSSTGRLASFTWPVAGHELIFNA